jgi:hypothetical protein
MKLARISLPGIVGLSVLLFGTGPAPADDLRVEKPQPAYVLFSTGRLYPGHLMSLTDKEFTFAYRIMGRQLTETYRAKQARAVQTREDIYIYNKGTDALQSLKDLEAKGMVTIEVLGVGKTPDEALKDAFRNAVQQVVGAIVETETLVKNDQVISDKVLTYSDGYITESKVIEEKLDGDLHVCKVRATVARTKMIHTLKDANVPVKRLDGESMFAQIVSQVQAEKDARALLEKTFEGFPANVIKAEILGKPEPLDKSETHVDLGYQVTLAVDQAKYTVFLQKAVPLLRKIASQKGNCLARAEPKQNQESSLIESFFSGHSVEGRALAKASHCESVMTVKYEGFVRQWWSLFDHKDQMLVVVNTGVSPAGYVTAWSAFAVPRIHSFSSRLQVEVDFLDKDQKVVARDTLAFGPNLPGLDLVEETRTRKGTDERNRGLQVLVSPFLMKDRLYIPQLQVKRSLRLSLDQLRQTSSLRCVVEEAGNGSHEVKRSKR